MGSHYGIDPKHDRIGLSPKRKTERKEDKNYGSYIMWTAFYSVSHSRKYILLVIITFSFTKLHYIIYSVCTVCTYRYMINVEWDHHNLKIHHDENESSSYTLLLLNTKLQMFKSPFPKGYKFRYGIVHK